MENGGFHKKRLHTHYIKKMTGIQCLVNESHRSALCRVENKINKMGLKLCWGQSDPMVN